MGIINHMRLLHCNLGRNVNIWKFSSNLVDLCFASHQVKWTWSCSSSQTQTRCWCSKGVSEGVFQQDFSRSKFCSFGRSMQADPFIGSWPQNEPHVLQNEHLKRPEAQSILTSYAAWASRSHGQRSRISRQSYLPFALYISKWCSEIQETQQFHFTYTAIYSSTTTYERKQLFFTWTQSFFFFSSCFLAANLVYVTTSKRKSTKENILIWASSRIHSDENHFGPGWRANGKQIMVCFPFPFPSHSFKYNT